MIAEAGLRYADLSGALLNGAYLGNSGLDNADLRDADLSRADLNNATLRDADLRGATLSGAILYKANLSRAKLGSAKLFGTHLIYADLAGTDFNEARFSTTTFSGVDVRVAKGLEDVLHEGPTEVGVSTFSRSEGQIPEAFLRGCGLRDWEIEASKLYRSDFSRNQFVELTYKILELRTDPLIQFNSCFISYSSKDEEFAGRLYSDLQDSGVRCWFAPEDMKIGDRIRDRLDDSILMHDKLLLILSEASVASQWIEQEVETALEKERERYVHNPKIVSHVCPANPFLYPSGR